MQQEVNLPADILQLLCCPVCKTHLSLIGNEFVCPNRDCANHYPVVDGIPVLINESNSVFHIADYLHHDGQALGRSDQLKSALEKITPSLGKNIVAKQNYAEFARLLSGQSDKPKVLVIGGRVVGQGMEYRRP